MIDVLWLFAASTLLTLLCSYAGWMMLRKIFIRQRLFAIRDRLWGEALEGGFLEDPGYRECREYINKTIEALPHLSLPLALYLSRQNREQPVERRRFQVKSGAARMSVRKAANDVSQTVRSYVLYWQPFSGIVLQKTLAVALLIRSLSRCCFSRCTSRPKHSPFSHRQQSTSETMAADEADVMYDANEAESLHQYATPLRDHWRFGNQYFSRIVRDGEVDHWWEDSGSCRSKQIQDAFESFEPVTHSTETRVPVKH